jgi:hypothetical protein
VHHVNVDDQTVPARRRSARASRRFGEKIGWCLPKNRFGFEQAQGILSPLRLPVCRVRMFDFYSFFRPRRSSPGKILKRELRAPFWEGRKRQVSHRLGCNDLCQGAWRYRPESDHGRPVPLVGPRLGFEQRDREQHDEPDAESERADGQGVAMACQESRRSPFLRWSSTASPPECPKSLA